MGNLKLNANPTIGLEYLLHEKSFGEVLQVCFDSITMTKRYFEPNNLEAKFSQDPQELLSYYALRGSTYRELGYENEFKTTENFFEYDSYDPHSLNIMRKNGSKIIGSVRLIIPNLNEKLPSAKYCDKVLELESIFQPKKLVEISRLVIIPDNRGGNTFFDLFKSIYHIGLLNDFNYVFSVIDEHVPMYLKMGSKTLEPSMEYGNMPKKVSVMYWDLNNVSEKYKKRFMLKKLN